MQHKKCKKNSKKIVFPLALVLAFYIAISTMAPVACNPSEKSAIGTLNASQYQAEIIDSNTYNNLTGGEEIFSRVKITNLSPSQWKSLQTDKENPVRLAYHWWRGSKIIVFDGMRTDLPKDLGPGNSITVIARIVIPKEPGQYLLEWDLVREGVSWFSEQGSATQRVKIEVQDIFSKRVDSVPLEYGTETLYKTSHDNLNKLQPLIRKSLEYNKKEFSGIKGQVKGFGAGTVYPEIWSRDNATIIPASRYYFSGAYLFSWIEEHLSRQNKNGMLHDWIRSDGFFDKNTVETDHEANIVHSAYQYYEITGAKDWLLKPVQDIPIINRLEKALNYVLLERFDKYHGLITGGHTADWGDVGFENPGQAAVHVNKLTHWTMDIYDQAMFFRAANELAGLYVVLGKMKKASHWRGVAENLQKRTNDLLWMEDKGFYKVHAHLTPLEHDFDEADIFAMGGNAIAIKSGLAGPNQAWRIYEAAEKRQKQYNITTIGASLLPPYPKDFFKNPILNDTFEYQNGGQWDWFGARLITTEFVNGYSRSALGRLLEVALKNINNRGLYEWDTPSGEGRGSGFFAGNAGVLCEAIFTGYFGISLAHGGLEIAPRLGSDNGSLRLYQPATDTYVAYRYKYSSEKKTIIMKFGTNFKGSKSMRILLPENFNPLDVALNNREINHNVEVIGRDKYIKLDLKGVKLQGINSLKMIQ